MPIRIDGTDLKAMQIGDTNISRVYVGNTLVFDSFIPTGMAFDNSGGTNHYLEYIDGLDGVSDESAFTLSGWVKTGQTTAGIWFSLTGPSASERFFTASVGTGGVVSLRSGTSIGAGNNRLNYDSTNVVSPSDGWRHLLFSVNSSGVVFYMDDVSQAGTTFTNTTPYALNPASGGSCMISGRRDNSGNRTFGWVGSLAEVYFLAGTAIDITVEANRRKFITADGTPADLGISGSNPTGSAPDLYVGRKPFSEIFTNRGTGGGFTETGTITQDTTTIST